MCIRLYSEYIQNFPVGALTFSSSVIDLCNLQFFTTWWRQCITSHAAAVAEACPLSEAKKSSHTPNLLLKSLINNDSGGN